MLLAVESQLHKAKEKDLLTSIDRTSATSGRQDDADRYVPITTVAAGIHVFASTAALCADDVISSSSTTGRFVHTGVSATNLRVGVHGSLQQQHLQQQPLSLGDYGNGRSNLYQGMESAPQQVFCDSVEDRPPQVERPRGSTEAAAATRNEVLNNTVSGYSSYHDANHLDQLNAMIKVHMRPAYCGNL